MNPEESGSRTPETRAPARAGGRSAAAAEAARRAAAEQAREARRRRARRRSPAGRRLSVRRRGLWAWFLPESRRISVAVLASALAYVAVRPLPGFEALRSGSDILTRSDEGLSVLGTLLIAAMTVYTMVSAALTHWTVSHLPRRELVALARLRRARRAIAWYRWVQGSTGARSDAVQMLVTCGLAVVVLLSRPDAVPVVVPLVTTAGAVVAAWIGCVVGYAVEYAAEDAHGDALDMPGIPGLERGYEEYLDLAVLVQTTSGPSGATGRTASARRALRSQSILAHVMSTVIVSLTVSVVMTALT